MNHVDRWFSDCFRTYYINMMSIIQTLLAAGICTKSGRALVSRQFVEMSRPRIEGLFAAFPKLTVCNWILTWDYMLQQMVASSLKKNV